MPSVLHIIFPFTHSFPTCFPHISLEMYEVCVQIYVFQQESPQFLSTKCTSWYRSGNFCIKLDRAVSKFINYASFLTPLGRESSKSRPSGHVCNGFLWCRVWVQRKNWFKESILWRRWVAGCFSLEFLSLYPPSLKPGYWNLPGMAWNSLVSTELSGNCWLKVEVSVAVCWL